ncbi:unnamed protein product, partial [Prorocentrum cordatum]
VSIFPTPVGGPVDVNGCEHARAPVFPSVVQPPVFPNEVPFSVPAPPFAVPNLSQVFVPQPRVPAAPEETRRARGRPCSPWGASRAWPASRARRSAATRTPRPRPPALAGPTACSAPTRSSTRSPGPARGCRQPRPARLPQRTSTSETGSPILGTFGSSPPGPSESPSACRRTAGDPTRKKSKSSKPVEQTGPSKGYPNNWSPGVTTVMVRQLPRHWSHAMFLEEVVHRGFKGLFDFVYLPHDFKKGSHVGFGFINFMEDQHALSFVKENSTACIWTTT